MSGDPTVDYGALAIADVTSDEINAGILRRLKDNDPDLDEFWIGGEDTERGNADDAYPVFDVEDEDERSMGVLGYYLGRCTHVAGLTMQLPEELYITDGEAGEEADGEELGVDMMAPFLRELRNNRSIVTLELTSSYTTRDFFPMLAPFIKGNPSLESVAVHNSQMGAEQFRSLTLALREKESKSLKEFCLEGSRTSHWAAGVNPFGDEESIIDNIKALKMHPRLETLHFQEFTVGRNACAALSDLLRQASLQTLDLVDNSIDDSGVEVLVDGLAHCRGLQNFRLDWNPSITARGWRSLASLLEDPSFSLQFLNLQANGIDDECATIIANALRHNNTLETLYLDYNELTGKSRVAFRNVICDTSSVNSTFLSNHTLHTIEDEAVPAATILFSWNRENDKKRVAVRKILQHHNDFDMQPLFEWDLKVLPFVADWLERAAAYEMVPVAWTMNLQLAVMFQFVRGMPELVVEGITGASKKSGKVGGEKRPRSAAFEGNLG